MRNEHALLASSRAPFVIWQVLDDALQPWLIELQRRPQMDASCPQDEELKDSLFLALLNAEQQAGAPGPPPASEGGAAERLGPPVLAGGALIDVPLLLNESGATSGRASMKCAGAVRAT